MRTCWGTAHAQHLQGRMQLRPPCAHRQQHGARWPVGAACRYQQSRQQGAAGGKGGCSGGQQQRALEGGDWAAAARQQAGSGAARVGQRHAAGTHAAVSEACTSAAGMDALSVGSRRRKAPQHVLEACRQAGAGGRRQRTCRRSVQEGGGHHVCDRRHGWRACRDRRGCRGAAAALVGVCLSASVTQARALALSPRSGCSLECRV